MTNRQYSASLEFTETEFRLPQKTSLNETKCGAILPATTGYCQTPIRIENETQLINTFGYPTDYNYKYWFDCSGFLKNGANLYVTRPLIEGSDNQGIGLNLSTVSAVSSEDLFNEESAFNTLDNMSLSTNQIELYNKFVTKNNDIAVAVVSDVNAFNSSLFNDTKLVSGLSYYYMKVTNFKNDTATKYDIQYVLDHSSTFSSNTFSHIYKGTDFVVAGSEPSADGANQGKIFINNTVASRFAVTGTSYSVALTPATKYLMKVVYSDIGILELPVKAITATTFESLSDDSLLKTTNITSVDFREVATPTVVYSTVTTPVISAKSSNVSISQYDGGAWSWVSLGLFIAHGIFTSDAKYYSLQKIAYTIGIVNYYELKLSTNKLPELATATGSSWHLIIDGNNYNVDTDGKFYQYASPSLTLLGSVAGESHKKPLAYNMVYTKDGDGVRVLAKIVPKYLVDGLFATDGSLLTFKDVIAPVPNFSKNEFAVLVFKKEFVSGKFDLVESFVGSWATTAKSSSGASNYMEKIINKNSQFVYCKVNSTLDLTTVKNVTTKDSSFVSCIMLDTTTKQYDRVLSKRLGDVGTESYLTANDLRLSADEFSIRGNTIVNLLIAYDNGLNSGYLDDMPEIAKESGMSLAVVSYDSGDLAGKKSEDIRNGIIDALGNKRQDTTAGCLTTFNDYTFPVATSKLLYDKYNDKDRWCSVAGDTAGRMAANDAVNGSWYATAGIERGFVNNYKRLLWSPSAVDQNELSRNGLNCIVNDKELGFAYMFEFMTNTTENKLTAEANIRRLLLTLKDYLRTTLKGTFFSFNDAVERSAVLYKITDTFNNIKSRRGLYDFRLICDESNNTADVINKQQFVVDVMIQPTRLVKFIKVNFLIFDAGFNLAEFEL